MRKPLTCAFGFAALTAAAILAAKPLAAASNTDEQNFALVEKGRALATASDCVACHTRPDGGKPFAGGRPIETPFGSITAPNITPDRDTGIGAWSDADFDKAVRQGIRRDGGRLYPAMPFTAFAKMSREDVLAIRAYLRTVPPVHNPVVANTLPFPFNIRASMRFWDWLYFKPGEFKPDPNKSAAWNRGAFLVLGPGHCGACHTPKTFLGGDKDSKFLQGGVLQGWFAPNITNDSVNGLGRWSGADIANFLKTGHNSSTAATGLMAEEIMHSSSHFNAADLDAIATYLKSLPGQNNEVAPAAKDDPAIVAGGAIYRDQCSACHGLDGKGVPRLFPSLADSAMVRSKDPTTLVRIVLRGARSVATKDEPTAPGMPSFGKTLDDAQVAAVVSYVRNAWKPAAAPVSKDKVERIRKDVQARVE